MTISGTAAQINAALTGLTYTNTPDYNGAAQIMVATNDGTVTTTNTIGITVTPVVDITNDTVTTNEDTGVSFNVITGTGGATADSFEGSITGGDGDQQGGVYGREPDCDHWRNDHGGDQWSGNGHLRRAANRFNGPTSFSYTVTSGGVTETATVNIGVTPVNDAPRVNTVPGAQTTPEDTAKAISGVSVADVDGDPLTTTLTITNGTASVTAGGGATIGGNGTSTVTLSGTAAQINAALTGLDSTRTRRITTERRRSWHGDERRNGDDDEYDRDHGDSAVADITE